MVQMMTNGVYRFCEWVTRLAYLNILWITFSMAGLLLFGFFPATAALFSVTRRWTMGEWDIPVFRTFWTTYKTEFWRANRLGLIIVLPAVLFLANFMIFEQYGAPLPFMPFLLTSFFLLYGVVALFLFPVYVHYNVTLKQTVKYALAIGLLRPIQTVIMIASLIGMTYIIVQHITFVLFFSGSAFGFVLMWFAMKAFSKVTEKQGEASLQQT
ncbi:YesL family protein [Domibacillus indicus]|uniref:YesL family protein n=1 Tax=Domibacillus indicus TaxID=1437523 RepID=UPI000617CAB8|nr:YesL family protein [Domibacillus indicus]